MAGLWSSISTFDVEKLFDTPVSRRQIWLGAAAIAAVSGSAYAMLSYKPVSMTLTFRNLPCYHQSIFVMCGC